MLPIPTRKAIKKIFPLVSGTVRVARILRRHIKTARAAYRLKQTTAFSVYRVYSSQSLLLRKLGNVDVGMQQAKVVNLKLALPHFTNIAILPHKTFSFWKLLGEPTYKKGYVDGMLLADGKIITGVGGGICQLANMLHWLFLHTGMTVVEHWHHDYDVFPDSGRCLPFGSGAGVFLQLF